MSLEEIQNNLINKIASLEFQIQEQKKNFDSEKDKLEKIIQAKNEEIEKFNISNTWEMAENSDSILKDQLEATQKMNAAFQADIQAKSKEISNYRNEISNLKSENEILNESKNRMLDELEKIQLEHNKCKDITTQ